jgi:hypothetical protein
MQRMLPFLDVDTGPLIPTFRGTPRVDSLWTLFRSPLASDAIDAIGAVAGLVDSATAGAVPTSMQTISLKQFRDAAQPDRALYQAIISCRTKYSNISNFQFYKEKDVAITFYKQGSFAEMLQHLALPPQADVGGSSRVTVRPKAAYRFNADIDFDNMRTLHTFSVDRDGGLPPTPASSDLTAPWLRPWKGFFGSRRRPL